MAKAAAGGAGWEVEGMALKDWWWALIPIMA